MGDVYTLIGSANINYRSFTGDPEMGAAVVDTATIQSADGQTVTKFGHDTRVKAMSEMGGFQESQLQGLTLQAAIALLASDDSAVEEVLELPHGSASALPKEVCDVTEIDLRCE